MPGGSILHYYNYVFDVDGTLVDSKKAFIDSLSESVPNYFPEKKCSLSDIVNIICYWYNYYGGDFMHIVNNSYNEGVWGYQRPMTYINSATAMVRGGPDYPGIIGMVTFQSIPGGTWICVNINGLPAYRPAENGKQPVGPFGFHIHEHGDCNTVDPSKPFEASGGHWNPTNQPHGNHAGDFPVLFSNNGRASMCFFTDKFTVSEVVGRAVIIHENPDDYRTQPAGNSGKRIACGVIQNTMKIMPIPY